ncbi:MAG: adenylate/guanylate cyclase domain-containing protein, partial [Mycobacterium sp.]
LRTAVFNRLTQVREAQSQVLERQFADLKNSLTIFTHAQTTASALQGFTDGFNQLNNSQISPAQWQGLVDYYNNDFIKAAEKHSGVTLDSAALLPTSNAQRYLQANYTVRKTDDAAALAINDAGDGSLWSAANTRYQQFFREIVTKFQYGDALLISGTGDVVYTALKDVDLGTNILNGPYSGSKLHDAYKKAMAANSVDYVGITDFEFYQPAEMQPTAWVVAPIAPGGKTIGVLAMQFPASRINELMTFDKNWDMAGLGDSGETYLVGPDGLMRSDSRLFVTDPQKFKQEVIAAGTPPDIAEQSLRQGGTTLVQPVASDATANAKMGQSGTLVSKDYLGNRTLQSYAPVSEHNSSLQWAIVAKIDTTEAFEREAAFTRTLVLTTVGISFGVCLFAVYLAQLFVRPIKRLETGVQRISAGDYQVAIPVETRDEIGDLTAAFNEMSRSLTVKEDLLNEQRRVNDELLKSLMPEPVVDRFREGEETIASEHHNVTVVFADILGVDELQAQMAPSEFLALINELIRQMDAEAEDLGIEPVRSVRNGYLASCGLTVPRLDNVRRTVEFAMECQRIITRFNSEEGTSLGLRAGIDTGDVGSGLVGRNSFVYDMWGGAVNLAHQIKGGAPQSGIYVTARVHDIMRDDIAFTETGTITVDGESQPVWRITGTR